MSLGTILVIILIIFLLGGFSGRFGGYGYGNHRPGRYGRHASADYTRQKSRDNYSWGLGERSSWQKIMKSSGTLATSLSSFESIR
jgi:hypothetical protein